MQAAGTIILNTQRCLLSLVLAAAGCVAPQADIRDTSPRIDAGLHVDAPVVAAAAPPFTPVSFCQPTIESAGAAVDPFDPLAGAGELRLAELVRLVQERNPTLQAMWAAWEAAAARYPQEVALDDPMLDLMLAPGSFSSNSNVPESWSLEAAQKIPWTGKRAIRGQRADAETRAALLDAEDTRLQLALAARLAFAEYVAAEQSLALNDAESKLAEEFVTSAQSRYETGRVTRQDFLQATVERIETQRRRVNLERQSRVAIARINTLLHRHPAADLPAAKFESAAEERLPPTEELLSLAWQSRPDLAAQAARIDAERAAYDLAIREFYPDVELYGRYDKFWFDAEQQASVGMKLNLPVQRSRRHAAVQEAAARIARSEAEFQSRLAAIRFEVEVARQRLHESQRVLALFRDELLNAAGQNATAAKSGYEVGTVDLSAFLSAQRQWLTFRQQQIEAAAEVHRQWAELERALGTPVSTLQMH